MKIIVYGAGKAGYKITETLAKAKQDVIVIDPDQKKLDVIIKNFDVLCINSHFEDSDLLSNLNLKKAEIFIAVTDHDEVNIIACGIAKRLGIKTTLARIRNSSYLNSHPSFLEKLKIRLSAVYNIKTALSRIS